ncbi:hypothetical protein T10_10700 [Trichinella papuae]|uniref:Uncharacterized protein n=1 Tax=Trichinella papuae TaxID=268474 RepID=A0A0V1MLX8_9BILA|nr:hypothetical protein T10_10700 [Trichinella papuae]
MTMIIAIPLLLKPHASIIHTYQLKFTYSQLLSCNNSIKMMLTSFPKTFKKYQSLHIRQK